jgi:hypothetical protein
VQVLVFDGGWMSFITTTLPTTIYHLTTPENNMFVVHITTIILIFLK